LHWFFLFASISDLAVKDLVESVILIADIIPPEANTMSAWTYLNIGCVFDIIGVTRSQTTSMSG
jgi:hypothetical protein